MKNAHFVTGATGFVGGAIVLKLLTEVPDDILCLIRCENLEEGQKRLLQSLITAAQAYGQPELTESIISRCKAYPGDITTPIPLNGYLLKTYSLLTIWHCAASLKFSEKDKDFIYQVNVGGATNICTFANTVQVRNTIYVSTAYVAGKKQGLIKEEIIDHGNETSNFYEASKIMAEHHLLGHCRSALKILRPSIVIGHSKTLAPTSFSGLYGFYIDVALFKKKVEKVLGSLLTYKALRILSNPEDPLNLIPVDYVSDAAVRIGLSDSSRQIFHLTNDLHCKVDHVVKNTFTLQGLKAPQYTLKESDFTSLDQHLDDHLEFYTSYLKGSKQFDRTNSLSVEGVHRKGFYMDETILLEFMNWFRRYHEAAGFKTRLLQRSLNKMRQNEELREADISKVIQE